MADDGPLIARYAAAGLIEDAGAVGGPSHIDAEGIDCACAVEIECGRNLLYKACWLRDQNRPFAKEAAMAKLYGSELMGRVVNHAVQIHGGYGLMKEYHVERFYRDQKLLDIGEGTSEVQRIVISRYIGC